MTALKSMFYVLTLSYILVMFVNPSLGISVSYGADGASSSSNYHLDKSTTLEDVGTLGDGTISRTIQVSGSGDNELSSQSTSAAGSGVYSAVKSSGELSTTTSTIASGDGALLNQNTQLTGESASISTGALGQENFMQVTGEGAINGVVNANLQAVASTNALVTGSVSDRSSNILSDESLKKVASNEDVFATSSHLYSDFRSFDASAINMGRSTALSSSAATAVLSIPPNNDGISGAYKFIGLKWSGTTPKVPLIVDGSNKGNGITGAQFVSAVSYATSTWNNAAGKALIGSVNTISTAYSPSKNSQNQIGWYRNGDINNLAITTSYGSTSTHQLTEADIAFNSNSLIKWSNLGQPSGSKTYDLQAVATHEMGHLLGMAHVTWDRREIMYSSYSGFYPNVGRYLGGGDLKGIKLLYR